MSRRILITSGPTQEPIDQVRSITNFSTGKTGAGLASFLAEDFEVVFLYGENSVRPSEHPAIQQLNFRSSADLDHLLREQLDKNTFHAVIHLAAVSDYSVARIEIEPGKTIAPDQGKLDSQYNPVLYLKKNPKLISQIRQYSRSDLKLIGFKLTRTSDNAEQIRAVRRLFEQSGPDYVVHNELSEINNGQHPYRIFDANDVRTTGTTKQELYQSLKGILTNKIQTREQP